MLHATLLLLMMMLLVLPSLTCLVPVWHPDLPRFSGGDAGRHQLPARGSGEWSPGVPALSSNSAAVHPERGTAAWWR
jgi:hypothetical protein